MCRRSCGSDKLTITVNMQLQYYYMNHMIKTHITLHHFLPDSTDESTTSKICGP